MCHVQLLEAAWALQMEERNLLSLAYILHKSRCAQARFNPSQCVFILCPFHLFSSSLSLSRPFLIPLPLLSSAISSSSHLELSELFFLCAIILPHAIWKIHFKGNICLSDKCVRWFCFSQRARIYRSNGRAILIFDLVRPFPPFWTSSNKISFSLWKTDFFLAFHSSTKLIRFSFIGMESNTNHRHHAIRSANGKNTEIPRTRIKVFRVCVDCCEASSFEVYHFAMAKYHHAIR